MRRASATGHGPAISEQRTPSLKHFARRSGAIVRIIDDRLGCLRLEEREIILALAASREVFQVQQRFSGVWMPK